MASVALVTIQQLVVNANDTFDIATLKTTYNKTLSLAQSVVADIGNDVNAIQAKVTNLNSMLQELNGLATGLNTLQPQAQVYGSQTVSTIAVNVTGQVNLI
jgi:peptidoglycan hydrolase CwlO-like protein